MATQRCVVKKHNLITIKKLQTPSHCVFMTHPTSLEQYIYIYPHSMMLGNDWPTGPYLLYITLNQLNVHIAINKFAYAMSRYGSCPSKLLCFAHTYTHSYLQCSTTICLLLGDSRVQISWASNPHHLHHTQFHAFCHLREKVNFKFKTMA